MAFDFDKTVDRTRSFSLKWENGEDAIPLWVADMDFECAPAITRAMQERIAQGAFGYTVVPDEWRQAVASWWLRRHSLEVDPSAIAFSSGVIPTLMACIRAFGKTGCVGVFAPGYNVFESCIRNAGLSVREVALDYDGRGYRIDFGRLEEALAPEDLRVFLLCNPHNPTGTIWSSSDLARLGQLCCEYGVVVVSDEIHCDIVRPDWRHVPFMRVSRECARSSITCGAPSKAFNIAGLQTSYAFSANEELLASVQAELAAAGHATPNLLAIQATIAAYTECDEWLDVMNAYVAGNMLLVDSFLARHPEMGMGRVDAKATYLCWLDCASLLERKGKKSTHSFQKHLKDDFGVFVYPGMIYGAGGRKFLRMNAATRRPLLDEALQRMLQATESWLA